MLSKIEPQRFELIRDAIGRVLCLEMKQQGKLQGDFEKVNIFLERTTALDKTELPALNIIYVESKLTDENTATESTFDNKFFIECYASSESDRNSNGDVKAAMMVTKIMGMVRAILRNSIYYYLDFEGEKFIQGRKIENIARTEPRIKTDAESTASGIVEVHYFANETTETQTGVLAGYLDTVVKLSDTEKGYKFIIN